MLMILKKLQSNSINTGTSKILVRGYVFLYCLFDDQTKIKIIIIPYHHRFLFFFLFLCVFCFVAVVVFLSFFYFYATNILSNTTLLMTKYTIKLLYDDSWSLGTAI